MRSLLPRSMRKASPAAYVIAFDLNHDRDYSDLFNQISRVGQAMWCLDAVWFLHSVLSASEIRDYLSEYLADGDRIVVVECGDTASCGGFGNEFNDWLTEFM